MKTKLFTFTGFMAALFILLIGQNVQAQFRVTRINDSMLRTKGTGIIYNLPATRLVIDIRLKKIEKEKGPYFQYAHGYLGIDKVVAENSIKYEMGEIKVVSIPEPDPQNYFLIETRGCPIFRHRQKIDLTPEGYLRSINIWRNPMMPQHQPEPQRGLVAEGSTRQLDGADFPTYNVNPSLLKPEPVVTEELDSSGNLVQRKVISKVETDDRTVSAKAAAEALAKVKDSRQNLLGGYQEVNYESGTLKLMTDKLRELEAGWLKLFIGSVKETDRDYHFEYLPGKQDTLPYILCYFSEKSGITDKAVPGSVALRIHVKSGKLLPEWKPANKTSKKACYSLAYRIPAEADYSLMAGDKQLRSGHILVGQLGEVGFLPAKVKQLEFFPHLGSIKDLRTK
jgi:hypothetical protein